ncbi:MAG TPA: MFS transporter [Chloroflexota bacterium]|jgi:MFS family permease|nr:MFS transporter [Chloroflexota bacterium]
MKRGWLPVSRNVLALGGTSLLTDISAEMITTALPLYLVYFLRLSPLEFGVVDGLYQGVAALVRVAGGALADRTHRYKEVAAAGYAISAICKLVLLAVGGVWTGIAGAVLGDRLGKGLRTAPRDALISLSAPRAALATAFGVHRALDTVGALLGPFVTFGILALAPNAFDAVFVASFCFALLGLGVLLLFAENRAGAPTAAGQPRPLRHLERAVLHSGFGRLIVVASLLALLTISDPFLYLALQRRGAVAVAVLPLLYVGTALVTLALNIPLGRLADRVGRSRVFLVGYVLLALAYLVVLSPGLAWPHAISCLALLGAYYAATDGVLAAIASAQLPAALRGSGLATLATATGLARLAGSVGFGALWTWWGLETSVLLYLGGLTGAILLALLLLRQARAGGYAVAPHG